MPLSGKTTHIGSAKSPSSQKCYDLGSSLRKRNGLQGKDGSTSVLHNLTKGSVGTDMVDDVRWMRMGGAKGQPLTMVAEVGTKDTGSDSYR